MSSFSSCSLTPAQVGDGLGWAALVVVVLNALGATIAIANRLPYEFGSGTGDPDQVASDFLGGGGTALSAPLPAIVTLAVFALIAQRRTRWGTLSAVFVLLLGGAFAFAGSQEPILARTAATGIKEPFDAVVVVLGVSGTLASVALVLLAARDLFSRLRTRGGRR